MLEVVKRNYEERVMSLREGKKSLSQTITLHFKLPFVKPDNTMRVVLVRYSGGEWNAFINSTRVGDKHATVQLAVDAILGQFRQSAEILMSVSAAHLIPDTLVPVDERRLEG